MPPLRHCDGGGGQTFFEFGKICVVYLWVCYFVYENLEYFGRVIPGTMR